MDATVEDAKTWIDNGWKKPDIIPDFLHVEGDASTICVLSHELSAADNQIVAPFTHTDVNNCIILKEKTDFPWKKHVRLMILAKIIGNM